ncbi:MAG: hypothetical protein HPY44_11035 [Armatimonadetes bacterium]|nr:hypothetical protein [Armatimonadota bacterium]
MNDQDTSAAGDMNDLTRRLGQFDVDGLRKRLDDLDRAPDAASDAPFRTALAEARLLLADARSQGAAAESLAFREAGLDDLETQVMRKLSGPRDTPTLAQGLRRLAAVLSPSNEGPATDEALARLDAAIMRARAAAAEQLAGDLGLSIMLVRPGDRIDPVRHEVVETRVAQDPALDNTVCSVEDAGWLLGDDVLVRAEVIRYAAEGGVLPTLPDLDDIPSDRLDGGVLGRKRSGQE